MFPPASRITSGDLVVGPREFLDRRTEFDLNLVWTEDRGVPTARAFYDSAHISETRARLFLQIQARLLEVALKSPEMSCRELLKAARSGHEAILLPKTTEPDPTARLHAAFFDWVQRTPDAPAIFTSGQTVTYRTLAKRVRQRVASLQAAGVTCLLYTSPSPRDQRGSRMPSSA